MAGWIPSQELGVNNGVLRLPSSTKQSGFFKAGRSLTSPGVGVALIKHRFRRRNQKVDGTKGSFWVNPCVSQCEGDAWVAAPAWGGREKKVVAITADGWRGNGVKIGVPDGGSKGWRMSRRAVVGKRRYFLSNISQVSRCTAVILKELSGNACPGPVCLCVTAIDVRTQTPVKRHSNSHLGRKSHYDKKDCALSLSLWRTSNCSQATLLRKMSFNAKLNLTFSSTLLSKWVCSQRAVQASWSKESARPIDR